MADRLETYRRKRRFSDTPEPQGATATATEGARFVVHEHHATRLHWDLRLEHDGVLASWAVPNGIPSDPKQNRKAVHTEDHPLEYIDFHGDIPEGNYGAGHMTIWDAGTYELEKWREDEVIVVFSGERLRGRYVLFQAGEGEKDWMIHRMDPPEDPSREPFPERIRPMLATAAGLPGDEDAWAFEVKWDGVRALAHSQPGRLHLYARSGNEITRSYPELAPFNRALSHHEAVLDGEIIAFDDAGRQTFQAVQQRIHTTGASALKRLARERPVTYMVFDLLWLDGHSLLDLPYEERRARLDDLGLAGGARWDVSPMHVGAGGALLQATAEQGLEGIVAKRLGSVYEPGARAAAWRKIKNQRRQEVVIGGYTPGRGGRKGSFGALQVGVYDDAGALRYAGGVGTGFTQAKLKEVLAELRARETDASPFTGRTPPKGTTFVAPELVCEVEFTEWTSDGSLRHPSFQGLRFDKDPADVVREPDHFAAETGPAGEEPGGPPRAVFSEDDGTAGAVRPPDSEPPRIEGDAAIAGGHRVKLTNPGKVYYPATGTTKAEVIAYYAAIAPVLVPHLAGRPVTLKRYPDGVEGEAFFEKRASPHRPAWVRTVAMPSGRHGTIEFVEAHDTATLLWTANLGAIELHPSLSRAEHPGRPTALVFDLDPGAPATIVECCEVALEIRALLGGLGLRCWAKTSGSKGLQLYAPLNMPVTYDQTKPFAQAVATLLESQRPELVVSRMKKSLRPGKVLIDWSQNDEHKTTVSVYSLRAREAPTASTPVTWTEVQACHDAGDAGLLRFTKDDVLDRVGEHGDLFAPLLELQQALPELS